MDSLINSASRYISRLIDELGQVAQQIDGNGWAVISVMLLICGWYWLKGSAVRSV